MTRTVRRIALEIEQEDLENLPLALGFAIGVLTKEEDRELAQRAIRRLTALHVALANAKDGT